MEDHKQLSVGELLTQENYYIPLYQRNFAWTYAELERLIQDIMDALEWKKEVYYIGTLVVSRKADGLELIDGQQRMTALTLLALVLKNEYGFNIFEHSNLSFAARQVSNVSLDLLSKQDFDKINASELYRGYRDIEIILSQRKITVDFVDYLKNRVLVFREILPKDLELNLYFERFNSRGEQLEAHEVIKARLMSKLNDEGIAKEKIGKFSRIWDICSEMSQPVIKSFKKKTKPNDNLEERESLFGDKYQNYNLANVYDSISEKSQEKTCLLNFLESGQSSQRLEEVEGGEELSKSLVNFPTFLYYVYYYTWSQVGNEFNIQLDDKKLLKTFEERELSSQWILNFGQNLLQWRFIFDGFVIKNSGDTEETEWELRKAVARDVKKSTTKQARYYRQMEYSNTFSSAYQNKICLLQSLFAVSYPANQASKWLYDWIVFLLGHLDKLEETDKFAEHFIDFLENYAIERMPEIKSWEYGKIPVYVFNFLDYVLWKRREELQKNYPEVKFDDFSYRYRHSVEHWYPQHPSRDSVLSVLDGQYLHAVGNLCLVTSSQNSKFTNDPPLAKRSKFENRLPKQSLKLQMMASLTEESSGWDKEEIEKFSKEILTYFEEFMITKN